MGLNLRMGLSFGLQAAVKRIKWALGLNTDFATGSQTTAWLRQADGTLALETLPADLPAREGMFLAQTVEDGARSGPELIVNGGFDEDTGWTKEDGWTISGGKAHRSSTGGNTNLSATFLGDLTVGDVVSYTITVSNYAQGHVRIYTNYNLTVDIASDGIYNGVYTVEANVDGLYIRGYSDFVGSIDNISLRKVLPTYLDTLPDGTPCHPYTTVDGKRIYPHLEERVNSTAYGVGDQVCADSATSAEGQITLTCTTGGTTATSLPTITSADIGSTVTDGDMTWRVGGYYYEGAGQVRMEGVSTNLFLNSSVPATQDITTTAQNYTVSVLGAGNITLSGTATGTATEGNPLTVTTTAGTLTCTVNGTLSRVQVEAGDYATSFIDTTDAPVTRPATDGTLDTSNVGKSYMQLTREHGAMISQFDTDTYDLPPIGTSRPIWWRNRDTAAKYLAQSGYTEYAFVGVTEDTSIYHRIDSVNGPYEVKFIGGNGATYSTTLNNVTTDVAAHGLTAPVTILVPDAVRTDEAATVFSYPNNQLTGSIPDLSSNIGLTEFYCYNNQLTGSIPDLSNNTALITFSCYNNQLTGSIPDLSSNAALSYFSCGNNQLTGSIPDLSSNTSLTTFYCGINQLTGSIPDLSSNTSLTTFSCYSNQLTGSIPDLSSNTALDYFSCSTNQLTGSIPDLSSNTALDYFSCSTNQLTGSIPDLSSNTSLTRFYCNDNQLTDVAQGFSVPNKSFTFRADSNALTQSAVDTILTAFDAAVTVSGGTINLSGGTNATPSAAGLTAKDSMIAKGWTVTTN